MPFQYNFDQLKEAILFNTAEILPTDSKQLDEEIRVLVDEANKSGEPIRHYIGFEISGQIHIGTGIMSALKIKKLQDAGVVCSIWLADYHTWLNNKLDGTIETARKVGYLYFGPVMRKCLEVVGGDTNKLEILQAETTYETKVNNQSFWDFDLQIAKQLTLSRILKSVSIMGKTAGEGVDFGTLRYPGMQVADAFFMQTHLVHAGMDQRKCHVLMRETAPKLGDNITLKIGSKKVKPIAIHHSLLLSLGIDAKAVAKKMNFDVKDTEEVDTDEELKMSKSKPDSAVWVTDSFEEISRKLKKAYCPMVLPEQTQEQIQMEQSFNPILNWCEKMIFPAGRIIQVTRPEKFGGDKTYTTFEELKTDYFDNNLHPMDLKNGVAKTLADWFEPIKTFVEANPEGLELIKNIKK